MCPLYLPLNAELNPICQLLALLGIHHIFHVSRIRVKVEMNIWAIMEDFNNQELPVVIITVTSFVGSFRKKLLVQKFVFLFFPRVSQ